MRQKQPLGTDSSVPGFRLHTVSYAPSRVVGQARFDFQPSRHEGLRQIRECEGIGEIPSDWRYSSTLNFYRRFYHADSVGPLPFEERLPQDKRAYVLWYPDGQSFIAAQHLQLVHRARRSDLAIAVRR